MIGTVYPNIPLSSASLHGHPRSSLGATLGVRMSVTAYGNLSAVSCVWPIGTSRLNLRPRPLSIQSRVAPCISVLVLNSKESTSLTTVI